MNCRKEYVIRILKMLGKGSLVVMVIGFCSKEPGGPIWHRTTVDERLIFKIGKESSYSIFHSFYHANSQKHYSKKNCRCLFGCSSQLCRIITCSFILRISMAKEVHDVSLYLLFLEPWIFNFIFKSSEN